MAVGESVKKGTLWDTRRPPRGNLALPSKGALLGGPYNSPVLVGPYMENTDINLERKRAQQLGPTIRAPVQSLRVGELDR